jgi:hypothetical protein
MDGRAPPSLAKCGAAHKYASSPRPLFGMRGSVRASRAKRPALYPTACPAWKVLWCRTASCADRCRLRQPRRAGRRQGSRRPAPATPVMKRPGRGRNSEHAAGYPGPLASLVLLLLDGSPRSGDISPVSGFKSPLWTLFGNYSLPVHIDAIRRVCRIRSGNPDLSAQGPSAVGAARSLASWHGSSW